MADNQNDELIEKLYSKKLFYFRLCCLCISHLILCRGILPAPSTSNTILLSDITYFYAFTHTYFSPHEYKTHSSEEIKVTLQEILGDSCTSKFSDRIKKKYTSPFIWGQMVSWFKQTIVNPEASLSQDRRGTLSYPLLNTIL
jgi:[histone H3]-lysine4 N-trimethyltransferase ATXR3